MAQPVSGYSAETARHRFGELVTGDDETIDLAEAALLIAAEEYSWLDVGLYLEKLDRFADIARERALSALAATDTISALNSTLFDDLGFRGNIDSYYDPRNSFLNEVIDRRIGIPITLTVVYIEVARRIGFPIKGVGMPGHFIAKYAGERGEVFIDPFNGGRLLGEVGCAELIDELSGGRLELKPAHLEAVTKKQILSRMLSNLLSIYAGSNDYPRALAAIERILLINPGSHLHVRDHGLLLALQGETARAARALERYLEIAPDAPDAEIIRAQIKTIRQNIAKLN
jgi:regulator of sirC expression with transglutaminase-like and TPR domain